MSFQDLSKSTDAVIGYITYEQVDEDDKIQDEFIEKYIGYVEPKKKDIDELIKYFKDLFDLEEISFDKIPKKYHNLIILNISQRLGDSSYLKDRSNETFTVFKLKETFKNKSLSNMINSNFGDEDIILLFERGASYVYSNLSDLHLYMYLCSGIAKQDYNERNSDLAEYIYNLKEFYSI